MAERNLQESWARTTAHLDAARAQLRPDAHGLRDYDDYLAHNELALAFDVLVQIGEAEKAKQHFWTFLASAAADMDLHDDDSHHGSSVRTVQAGAVRPDRYPCPCCGYLTLEERGGDDICPVCFWEDDGQDDHDADEVRGGPNYELSLSVARSNFRRIGAASERVLTFVRPPQPDEVPPS
jgi:hypothetical protein